MSRPLSKSFEVFSSTSETKLSTLVTVALDKGYELQGPLIVTHAMIDIEGQSFVLVYTQAVIRAVLLEE